MWPARLLVIASCALLLHAAYSARHTHSTNAATAQLNWASSASPEVIFEALGAFVCLVVGILWSAPTLKGVTWASEMSKRSIDSEDSGIHLANMRHRGGVLFRETTE
ncbi:hypothetical protein JCM8547_001549 [Rhodosporidiobolus lusitaniae]